MKTCTPKRSASGFTLLEVVIAIAILALSLMGIFRLNSGAIAMHAYTKRLAVATLLARSKMIDVEQELYDKGFSVDDQEESGDFSTEGWTTFKWKAKILAPRTQNISPEQLITALFNVPMGPGGLASLLGGASDGGLGSFGSSSSSSSSAIPGALGPGQTAQGGLGALGPMAGLVEGQFTQMIDQLGKAVREIHVTVYWKDGKRQETLDVVTHLVAFQPGGDRNGAQTGQGLTVGDGGVALPGATGIAGSGVPTLNTNIGVH